MGAGETKGGAEKRGARRVEGGRGGRSASAGLGEALDSRGRFAPITRSFARKRRGERDGAVASFGPYPCEALRLTTRG